MDEPSRPVTTVASWLTMQVTEPAWIAFQLAVTPGSAMAVDDLLAVTLDGRPVPATEILDEHHSRQHLVEVDRGTLAVTYRGAVTHHGPQVPEALTTRSACRRPDRAGTVPAIGSAASRVVTSRMLRSDPNGSAPSVTTCGVTRPTWLG